MQVEGAIKSEGRGPSVIEQEIGRGREGVQDIAGLAAVGVKDYSFSISWSRILPFGVPGSPVNQETIDHYNDLINTVLEYGMKPLVTLHHPDTPLHYLSNTSWQGYDHPEFVEGFFNYAKIVLTHYSDRISTWVTFNEPTLDGGAGSCIGNSSHPEFPACVNITTIRENWQIGSQSNSAPWAQVELAPTLFYLPIFNEILKSTHEDGVEFKGALGWAYINNWELVNMAIISAFSHMKVM
ncbi:glycoside hydrolase superfamily [Hypoxylon crocopeplum]|nr:glycoside hydrolase superfamily [Hypoxylon crocopeplum]